MGTRESGKKAPSRVGGSMPSRWLIVRGKSDIPQNIDRENHIKVIRRKYLANIKSAKKRIKVINKKTLRNKMIKSQVKTAMKKVIVAVNAGDKETAAVALKNAVSAIDRAYIKGIYHKNAVARKKSSLTRLVNSL